MRLWVGVCVVLGQTWNWWWKRNKNFADRVDSRDGGWVKLDNCSERERICERTSSWYEKE